MPYPAYETKQSTAIESAETSPAPSAKILYFPLWPMEQSQAAQEVLATKRERVWAHVIDACFVHGFSLYAAKWISFFMANAYMNYFRGSEQAREDFYLDTVNYAMPKIWFASFCIFSLLYVVSSHHWWGRSLGKALLGLRVVDNAGNKPSVVSSLRRYFAYWISYCTLGLSFVLSNSHENITHTKVIKEK